MMSPNDEFAANFERWDGYNLNFSASGRAAVWASENTCSNTIGAMALATLWKDPAFDAKQRASYYVRVIEIPTPRSTKRATLWHAQSGLGTQIHHDLCRPSFLCGKFNRVNLPWGFQLCLHQNLSPVRRPVFDGGGIEPSLTCPVEGG